MASRSPIEMSDVCVGMIVHFFDTASQKPKPKFSIIVGISEDSLLLATAYINTNIDPRDLGSPELEALHYELQCSNYSGFLKDNSHVNCAKPIYRTRTEFLEAINGQDGNIVGHLNKKDLREVVYRLRNGTIPPYKLDFYGIPNI